MLDDFVLGDKLVEGGNGVVYRTRQRDPARDVIVKVTRAQHRDNAVARERFLRLGRHGALSKSPHAMA
ncbi:MAG TPA: hypothetical protein VGC42_09135 [Kofleriaceae bacterium]